MTEPPPFEARTIEVVIEVARGSFVRRDAAGRIEFLSPLPCPFNYGCVPSVPAADGDALDAVLLGPRLAAGQRRQVAARALVQFIDEGQEDHKLICAATPLSAHDKRLVLAFFRFYALSKRLMNRARGRHGATLCLGWGDPAEALGRTARPR
jgi:inorganic pyrophosphatase